MGLLRTGRSLASLCASPRPQGVPSPLFPLPRSFLFPPRWGLTCLRRGLGNGCEGGRGRKEAAVKGEEIRPQTSQGNSLSSLPRPLARAAGLEM